MVCLMPRRLVASLAMSELPDDFLILDYQYCFTPSAN